MQPFKQVSPGKRHEEGYIFKGQDRKAISQFFDQLQSRIKAMYLYLQKQKVIQLDDILILFSQELPDEEELVEVKVGNR